VSTCFTSRKLNQIFRKVVSERIIYLGSLMISCMVRSAWTTAIVRSSSDAAGCRGDWPLALELRAPLIWVANANME